MSTHILSTLSGHEDDRSERARAAVSEFRKLQPTLTTYAQILTGNKNVRVEVASHDNGSTDGKRIFFRPPIALGDKTPHQRALCDRRGEDGFQSCPACAIREQVIVTIMHEIGHIAFDTFENVSEDDKRLAIEFAVKEVRGEYAKAVADRIKKAPKWKTQDYMNLASLVNEFLPTLVNALEDARVDSEMFKARKGLKQMFDADNRSTFVNGFESVDENGSIVIRKWNEAPLNHQAIVGCFVKASGYDYAGWFHADVEAALDDEQLTDLFEELRSVKSASGVYKQSFKVLARLRELGFCGTPQDPDPEPQPEEKDETPEDSSPEDQDSSPEEEPGEGESESGESGEAPSESDSGGGSPEESSDAGGMGSEDHGKQAPDDSGESASGPTDREGEVDESDDAGMDEEGSPSSDAVPEDAESSDQPDGNESTSSGGTQRTENSPEPADQEDDSGSGSEGEVDGDEGNASDGDSSETDCDSSEGDLGDEAGSDSDEPGDWSGPDADSDLPEAESDQVDSEVEPDGRDEDSGEGGDGSHEVSNESTDDVGDDSESVDPKDSDSSLDGESASPSDNGEPDDDGSRDDSDPIDTGADDGYGGTETDVTHDRPEMGSWDDLPPLLKEWGMHDEKPKSVHEEVEAEADAAAIDQAILQGIYFTRPSQKIAGVREHFYGKPLIIDNLNYSHAWADGKRWTGSKGEFEVDDQLLQPVLLDMRRTFSDNRRGAMTRNMKSGRVDSRVLGRRAWSGDERLFHKKTRPGKKSYHVVIGMDISGSTVGKNIVLEKKAIWAQAELLHRTGIEFSIYAHTGNYYDNAERFGMALEIYHIKDPHESWGDPDVRKKLLEIGPSAANLDGHALEFLRKRADESRATDKIILYYSDGKMPQENHDEELDILKAEIETCRRSGYTLLGVGIRTDSPKRHGLDTVQVESEKDMTAVVRHIGRRLAEN